MNYGKKIREVVESLGANYAHSYGQIEYKGVSISVVAKETTTVWPSKIAEFQKGVGRTFVFQIEDESFEIGAYTSVDEIVEIIKGHVK